MSNEYETLSGHGHKRTFFQRFKFPIIGLLIVIIALLIVFAVIYSARTKAENKAWEDQVNVDDIMGHLRQLQTIADQNNGTRASSTSGYNASIDYVVGLLQKHTDYSIVVEDFNYSSVVTLGAGNITISNSSSPLVYLKDFSVYGGPGGNFNFDNINTTLASNYGCNASDYEAKLPGQYIFLVKRGICSFADKAKMAASQGPVAVFIYNEGNTNDRMGLVPVEVGFVSVPVFGSTYAAGAAMMNAQISFSVSMELVYKFTKNIIADTKKGKADSVVVVGSHLDSVPAGPGINDNGSGSSLNLALALMLAKESNQEKLQNKVRFCWFGAEELGLLGSVFYVMNLNSTNPAEIKNIAAMLNFDMIGSPNFMRGVYNGSSDTQTNGSAVIQDLFNAFYAKEKIDVVPTEFSGRSDYGPFLAMGIPSGGLFTGAEEVKNMQERKLFGGLANAAYDPCYHQACDDINNINIGVAEDMARGAAHVLESLSTHKDLRLLLNPL